MAIDAPEGCDFVVANADGDDQLVAQLNRSEQVESGTQLSVNALVRRRSRGGVSASSSSLAMPVDAPHSTNVTVRVTVEGIGASATAASSSSSTSKTVPSTMATVGVTVSIQRVARNKAGALRAQQCIAQLNALEQRISKAAADGAVDATKHNAKFVSLCCLVVFDFFVSYL